MISRLKHCVKRRKLRNLSRKSRGVPFSLTNCWLIGEYNAACFYKGKYLDIRPGDVISIRKSKKYGWVNYLVKSIERKSWVSDLAMWDDGKKYDLEFAGFSKSRKIP